MEFNLTVSHGCIITTESQYLPALVWQVDTGWMPGVHQSCYMTSPPQLDRGEKIW